jgi:glycosyltransferase involved in cell wall biosynthesis
VKLSVIIVTYDMARELPRSLQSLTRGYQEGVEGLDFEILVIDNGSPEPVPEEVVAAFGPEFKYHCLENPPPSPAYALNYGARHATGDVLCFMVDGAHMLTPGVFAKAMASFRALPTAVVITRYFYLGPGQQNETMLEGYNKKQEDRLLEQIQWPDAGYRLFEIGAPLAFKEFPTVTWFYKPLESNCLFISARRYADIGGSDERFDIPGGGFMNIDLFRRICNLEDTVPVMLIGEGSFHQLHGGTTTNVTPEEQTRLAETYREQYRVIHGEDLKGIDKELYYFGQMSTEASKIHRQNRNKRPN